MIKDALHIVIQTIRKKILFTFAHNAHLIKLQKLAQIQLLWKRGGGVNAQCKNLERLHKIAQTCTNPSVLEERGLLMHTAKIKKDCTKWHKLAQIQMLWKSEGC